MSAELVTLLVAALTGLVAFVLHVLQERAKRRDALRRQFADALADVFSWIELPYRVRRREVNGRASLVDLAHQLQERLQQHRAWLLVEDRDLHDAYLDLVAAARTGAAPLITAAWEAEPLAGDAEMNLGDTGGVDLTAETDAYVKEVGRYLFGYSFKIWR